MRVHTPLALDPVPPCAAADEAPWHRLPKLNRKDRKSRFADYEFTKPRAGVRFPSKRPLRQERDQYLGGRSH